MREVVGADINKGEEEEDEAGLGEGGRSIGGQVCGKR